MEKFSIHNPAPSDIIYLSTQTLTNKGATMIKNATFISVWDDAYHIESSCKVDTETMEVFDIEMVDVSDYDEDFDSCTYEYVIIDDNEYDVSSIDCRDEDEYWYK